jgi:hypothetical protein
MCYTDTAVQYKMAVTADYCIIWEEQVGVSYASGQWAGATTGNGTTYWSNTRYGSIYYMGMRDAQAFENARDDNPAWVCWQHTATRLSTGVTATPWATDAVVAWMAHLNADGTVGAPIKRFTMNTWSQAYFNAAIVASTTYSNGVEGSVNAALQGLDPLFKTRNWGNGTVYQFQNSQPGTSQLGYLPQFDSTTGTNVPGAYPMTVSMSVNAQSNPGGKCRGMYKSLSMPYAQMKQYWQSANQTFTVGGDTYMPIVILEDMWLVRVA